jgi:anaerobic selenocysteine-containing dehydrogenase
MRVDERREGAWRRATWSESIAFIADRLERVRARYGPQALALYMGSTNQTIDTVMVRRFARVFGTPNVTRTWSVCVGPKTIAYDATFGSPRMPWCDLRHARYIVLWGTNPAVSQLHRYHGITADILAAQRDGAKLVVIDPRRIELAQQADLHLRIRPGSDLALALSLIRTIIAEGLHDRAFVERYTTGFDRLAEHIRPFTPAWAEARTDIRAADIEALAREFASTRPASLERREGVQHNAAATQTLRGMAILLALTGNVDVRGGLRFTPSRPLREPPLPADLPATAGPFWHTRFPLVDDCSGGLPEAILADGPSPIRALIVLKGNPMSCFPNTEKTIRALKTLDLLVVHDLFETETAELADVLLPGCTFFEKGEICPKSLRHDRRLHICSPVIPPLDEALPEWQFFCQLGHRLGHGQLFPYTTDADIVDALRAASGWTEADFAEQSVRDGRLLESGFATPSGKIELYSGLFERHGYDPLPTPVAPVTPRPGDPGRYHLITGARQSAFMHSQQRNVESLRSLQREPLAEVGETVAREVGLAGGEWIEVRTLMGAAVYRAVVSPHIHARTVSVPHGWRGRHNANWLTDDAAVDPIAGTPAYKDLRCAVRILPEAEAP